MITGVDMLFVVVGLILLLILVEVWDRYSDWREWDFDRRRERKLYRLELQDHIEEKKYRRHLRLVFNLLLVEKSTKSLTNAMTEATKSLNKFGELFRKKIPQYNEEN